VHEVHAVVGQEGEQEAALGLEPVDSLAEGRARGVPFAVPIIHTRVSYLALHTDPALAQEVARRASRSVAVDLALSRGTPPAGQEAHAWYTLWRGGEPLVTFGHDAARDVYLLPAGGRWAELGLDLQVPEGQESVTLADEDLFARTVDGPYPDLFFRARTALEPLSVEFPAEVLLSFRRPYASAGFRLPGGANEIANEGFHGGLDAGGSRGLLLTEERALPRAVRSDNLLELFPALREHALARGVTLHDAEPNAALDDGR
jgi:hypothetical protein